MYQLTENPDLVLNVGTGASIPRGHRWWDEFEAWKTQGNTPQPAPGPSFAAVVSAAIDGVQLWIDRTAQQNGYDSAVSCVSYLGSTVQRWRLDAEAMRSWRDAVWQAAHAWRSSLGGNLPSPLPTIDEIIGTLPQPRDYGWTVHESGAGSEAGEQS